MPAAEKISLPSEGDVVANDVTSRKLLQPLKAKSPIDVTLLGIMIAIKESIAYAKFAGIRCTLSPIFILLSDFGKTPV